MAHPWHDVELGSQAPEILPAIIEVPKGSKNKYELDKPTGLIKVDRVLFSAVHYPANYGFIPRTYCDDKDPLDILVLGQEPVVPLCIMWTKPIGGITMLDDGKEDDKIVSVHIADPEYASYNALSDLPSHRMREIQRFFEDYKALENRTVKIGGLFDRKEAHKIIRASIELYKNERSNF